METIFDRLERACAARGMNIQQVAPLAKVTPSALYQWKDKPAIQPKASTLLALGTALNVSPEWLSTGKGAMEAGVARQGEAMAEVPIWHAKAAAGLRQENGDGDPAGSLLFRPKSLAKKGVRQDKAHAFYVAGDSMAPRLRDGDVILFDTADLTIRDGKMFVIRWGDDTLVKRLYRELDGGVRVVSDNPDPAYRDRLVRPDDEGFEIIGRVRWTASWED